MYLGRVLGFGIALFLIATVICPNNALAAKPIHNIIDEPIPAQADGSLLSVDDVRLAVIAGSTERGWQVKDHQPGVLIASTTVRAKHFAEVEISYDQARYSIVYLSSDNLDYNAKRQRFTATTISGS